MRSILVEAGRDPGMSARLETALAVARAHRGHVTLLVDTPIGAYVLPEPFGGAGIAVEALESAIADGDALVREMTAHLVHDDVPFDAVHYELDPVEALAEASRLADLLVVTHSGLRTGEIALEAACPVLALPAGTVLRQPPRRVAIAWDGGLAAARALRGSVPLLAGCETVQVLSVTREASDSFPPTEALRYLSRHGVEAELTELVCADSVEQTLAGEVDRLGVDLLVMGAYGHSPVREFLFGGVTRYFLADQGGPALLLAH